MHMPEWLVRVGTYCAQRIYGPASGALTIIALVIGALSATGTYISLSTSSVPPWFIYLSGGYPLLLTGWVIFREIDLARRRRYAPSLKELQACFRGHQELCAVLRDTEHRLSSQAADLAIIQEQFTDKLTSILTSFAQMFTIITGVPCRSSVKIIPSEQLSNSSIPLEDLIVVTMARDRESQEQNFDADRDRFEKRVDKIVSNTDFEVLYSPTIPDSGFYHCGSIPRQAKTGRYRNSSIQYRRSQYSESDLYEDERYVLPYRSSITWPIRNRPYSRDRATLIGFLSIDAPSRRVFDPRWDAPIGGALASALFEPIYRYSEMVRRCTAGNPATQIMSDSVDTSLASNAATQADGH